MTKARVRAGQASRPPKAGRLVRAVVATVSPLTVQIAGGSAVPAIAVPGTIYTVGAIVLVTWQEPNVGPAHLLSSTPTPPPTRVDGTFAYSNQATDWDSSGWRTTLTRSLGLGSLTLAAKITTAIGNSGLIGTIPAGFGPRSNFTQVASIYSPGWNGATAHLQFSRDADGGAVNLDWCSLGDLPAGCLLTCAAGYPLP